MRTLEPSAFEGAKLLHSPGFLAVCFEADWCGFCTRFLPHFESRSAQAGIPFALADLSSEDDLRWDTLGIRAVPTLILFKDGEAVWRADARLGVGLFEKHIDRMLAAVKRA
ncbi:MAG TPA: thioredoxin family protein [Candidatus Thermoplasmatota archaeon]|nr:thioredoxin family protein [Candidatus Thermoplasmatota archaeon]